MIIKLSNKFSIANKLSIPCLVIVIILLSLAPIYSIASFNSSNFKLSVENNEELIWLCKKCDKNEMKRIFEKNWSKIGWFQNIEEEKKLKISINNIKTLEGDLEVIFDIWLWTDLDFSKSSFYRTNYAFSLDNPKINFNNTQNEIYTLIIFFFPVPVEEYMNQLQTHPNRDVDTRVLPTINEEIPLNSLVDDLPKKHIQSISIYNENGILSSFKLYTPGFNVFLELWLYDPPISVSPLIFLLLSGIIAIIGFYIINEKKELKNLRELKKSKHHALD